MNREKNSGDATNPQPRSSVRSSVLRVAVTIAVLIGSVLQSASFGQSANTITIGGQLLRVRMQRADALAALAICCTLTGAGDSFFVHTKTGPPFEILGAVWFKDGRVSQLRRDRNHSENADTAAFALALFRTVSEVTGSRSSTVTLRTETSELSNGTTRTIRIEFSTGKALTLSVLSADDEKIGRSVQLAEEQVR